MTKQLLDIYSVKRADSNLSEFIELYLSWDKDKLLYPDSFEDFCKVLNTYQRGSVAVLSKTIKRKYGLKTDEDIKAFGERVLSFYNKYSWDDLFCNIPALGKNSGVHITAKEGSDNILFDVDFSINKSIELGLANRVPIVMYVYTEQYPGYRLTLSQVKEVKIDLSLSMTLEYQNLPYYKVSKMFDIYENLSMIYFTRLLQESNGGLLWE